MKSRPILMSGENIQPILDGSKTQTRREIKAPIVEGATAKGCKYGTVGDQLWVKETFQPVQLASEVTQWRYRATDEKGLANWKPSIFMPRWASRITLEITGIRVERLQEISENDAQAEGCSIDLLHSTTCDNDNCALAGGIDDCDGITISARENYIALWERINGPGSWDKNPWVWVISFKKIIKL